MPVWRLPPTVQGMSPGKLLHLDPHGWMYIEAPTAPLPCAVLMSNADLEYLEMYTAAVKRRLSGPMIHYLQTHVRKGGSRSRKRG